MVQNNDANKNQSVVESAEAEIHEQKIESSTETETVEVNLPADQSADSVEIFKCRIEFKIIPHISFTMNLVAYSHGKMHKYWKLYMGLSTLRIDHQRNIKAGGHVA